MRCVNIDWLEVSAEESGNLYPCDAEFFRSQGFWVKERAYGTRVWGQVFTLDDDMGHPWLEIRRQPPSGTSEFKGLTQYSCRIRLVNAQCYVKGCVEKLRDFMIRFDYIYKRIARIDICYDFERFDTGDKPAKVARRIITKRYRKVNQNKIRAIGKDNWQDFEWESLSWGSLTSMVSTKLYNKTKELKEVSKEKTYIPLAWFECGLIDDPINRTKRKKDGKIYEPDIWRLEFSMKSKADRWLIIEDISGKRMKKQAVQHHLSTFDSPDKIWQRFQDLSFHYFRFKIAEGQKRKNLFKDKILFRWDKDHQFMQLDMAVRAEKPNNSLETLRRRLISYRATSGDMVVRDACTAIIDKLNQEDARRYTPRQILAETQALQQAISIKMKHPEVDVLKAIETIKEKLIHQEIW